MRILRLLIALPVFLLASPSYAEQPVEPVDGYDVFVDVLFLRPTGLVALVAGSAVFVAVSPFTAIASIPEPHNAFPLLYDTLVVGPARYTFVRPVEHYLSD